MRLVDLRPQFAITGGSGVSDAQGNPVPLTEGVGIVFDCPCGNLAEEHRCYVPFANPIGPGQLVAQQGWQRTGDAIETLTLRPSIWRHPDRGGCGWHGFITHGEVSTV